MFAPPMGPQMGMDPICLIALQAGMSGRSAQQQQLSLEDQIADIETRLEGLNERIDELREELLEMFKTSDCKRGDDNTGDICPALSNGSRKKIRARSIVDTIDEHIGGKKDAPPECDPVASEGVAFYFEDFLPHIQYGLNLPLTLISPAVAFADTNLATGSSDPSTPTGTDVPGGVSQQEEPESEIPVREPASCQCPEGSAEGALEGTCQVSPRGDGSQCPEGWQLQSGFTSDGNFCWANCTDGLEIKWPAPASAPISDPAPPTPGSCSNNSDCETGKKCENNRCVDLCPPETPAWVIHDQKCICVDNSTCGNGKVCQNGACVEAPAPLSAFNWCEGDNCKCRYKKYFGDEGQIDIDGLCEDPLLLPADADGNVERRLKRKCKSRLEWIQEDIEEFEKLADERDELKDKKEEQEDEAEEVRRRCERNPNLEICKQKHPGVTEAGTFCTSCFQEVIDAAYPKKSGWDRLLDAVVPLAGTGLAYYGIKETNELRSRQGYPVDNSAMYGLAYPFIAQMLYGGALNGRGRNALACSPSTHMNPYAGHFGLSGNLYANMGLFGPGGAGAFGPFGPGGNLYANMGILGPGGAGAFGPFGPGGNLYANMGILGPGGAGAFGPFGPGGNLYANMGVFGPGGAGAFGLGGAGAFGPFGPGGAGGFDYHSQMQMQQRMQSYYMQLQQFQMEQQRMRQATVMRYQQEAQALALKYQNYLSTISYSGHYPSPGGPGGVQPYPPPYSTIPYIPGGSPGGATPGSNIPRNY